MNPCKARSVEAFWSPAFGGSFTSRYARCPSAVQKPQTEQFSGKVAMGRMELLRQNGGKAREQRIFGEGFQALAWAVHTACLIMLPLWTMLGKSLPDPSHICLQRQSASINPCFISSHSVWTVAVK